MNGLGSAVLALGLFIGKDFLLSLNVGLLLWCVFGYVTLMALTTVSSSKLNESEKTTVRLAINLITAAIIIIVAVT